MQARGQWGLSSWPLRWKMVALLLCAALPLVFTAVNEMTSARRAVQDAAVALLDARADQLGSELEEFSDSLVGVAERLSRLPPVGRFCQSQSAPAEMQQLLNAYGSSDKRIHAVHLFDTRGGAIASTGDRAIADAGIADPGIADPGRGDPAIGDRRVREGVLARGYLRDALEGRTVISDLFIDSEGRVPLIAFAAPVLQDGRIVGVAAVTADARAFWRLVGRSDGRAGQGSFSAILDRHGIAIAHSARSEYVLHPAAPMGDDEAREMIADRRFGDRTQALLSQPFPAREAFEIARAPSVPHSVIRLRATADQAMNLSVVRRLARGRWTLFYLVPEATLRAPLERLFARTAAATAVALLLALLLGTLLARRILGPIEAISRAADALRRGDRTPVRVQVAGRDELGQLAETFAAMAASLEAARSELEEKIAARTEALERANLELERQNGAMALRTTELGERQARDRAFGATLSALAGEGPLAVVVQEALARAEEFLATLVLVCYRVEGEQLVPFASVGADQVVSVEPAPLAGRMAQAIRSRRLVTLDPMPDDADLRFDAGLVSGRPRCLSLVPLVIGDRELGIVAAGSAEALSPQALAFLSELALPLSLTIARHDQDKQIQHDSMTLAQRNAELHQQAAVLADQGKALLAQQAELSLKNREVESANLLKSEFLDSMSHELRTPLNAVIGFSELLLDDTRAFAPGQLQYVRDILASGRHLLSLINSVLDLAKVGAGRVTHELVSVSPAAEIAIACALIAADARKKGITLAVAADGLLWVRADRAELQQILLHLLSNAIKFSRDQGRVEIGAQDAGEMVRFWVRDQGPGIPEPERRALFKPFAQGDPPMAHQGTGLGLAISKRLVRQHGGDIGVESEPGHGSRFWFTLQATRRPEGAEPARPVAPPEAGAAAPTAPLGTVLVVDDHDLNRELARTLLERRGCRVLLARNGAEGVRVVRAERPQLVLMDLAMPIKDGMAACRELKADPQTADIPLVAFTALAMRGDEERAMRAGFDGYLAKPIDKAALNAMLTRFLGDRRRQATP